MLGWIVDEVRLESDCFFLYCLSFDFANQFTFGLVFFVRFRLLLVFHASILEPDLDLSFGERQIVRYLDTPATSQVFIEVKLFLELQGLISGVGLSASFSFYFMCECVSNESGREVECN